MNYPKNVKRFDFTKKPIKPTFLMGVAKGIISKPDLKKRGAKIVKTDMEELEGRPYLLLVTHSSMVDFNLMLMATHPYPVNNVMTLEGFNTYTAPLMRSLGVLGKRKFVSDPILVKQIRYCLNELKTIFVLFPEARYSLDGCGSYVSPSTAALAASLKVPVAVLKIKGNFITCPQWNKMNKKTYVEAELCPILKPSEIGSVRAAEIHERIKEAFTYNDFEFQKEKGIVIDHPQRAEGLHCLLYKCPHCMTENETYSEGSVIECRHCGKKWEMTELGEIRALDGETEFESIPKWSDWERACVRKEIEDGTYSFVDENVRLETLPGWTKFYKQGNAKLVQNCEGTFIYGTVYGEPFELHKKPLQLESMHIEYDYLGRGDAVDISVPDDSYWCYLSKRDAITKISFATEELHFIALKERAKTRSIRKTTEAVDTNN